MAHSISIFRSSAGHHARDFLGEHHDVDEETCCWPRPVSTGCAIAELFPKEYEFHRTSARLMARCSTITAENAAAEELAPEQDTPFRDKQILAITDRYEEVSLKHLRNAIALGCSDAASLAKHGAYLSIHDHPEFRKLIGAGE